jgi:16S rRNA (uracil1498-N3)-methyltransferase
MHLFYTDPSTILQDTIRIEGQEATHIGKVLRHGSGDIVHITDGNGQLIQAEILNISKSALQCRIISSKSFPRPLSFGITLAVGSLKSRDKMEWITEKAVELGIGRLVFMQTQYAEREKIRIDRLQGVAVSAMKQSLQCWLPSITAGIFDKVIAEMTESNTPIVLAHERESGTSPHDWTTIGDAKDAALFIGPEGGFSQEEVAMAENNGAKRVNLGPNRLRTETAAIHLLSVVRHYQQMQSPSNGVQLYGS